MRLLWPNSFISALKEKLKQVEIPGGSLGQKEFKMGKKPGRLT
jgi:hypothetical protein